MTHHSEARTEGNKVQTHIITNVKEYPNFHFSLFRKDELKIQSNIVIETDDIIVNDKQQFKVASIRKVEPTINELTGYWDTQGSGKNQKRRWVERINNYEKNLTKYYILEITKL